MSERDLKFSHEEIVGVALKLLPPTIRNSLISDEDFRRRHNIKTEATIAFGDSSATFKRSTLFGILRQMFSSSGPSQTPISTKEGIWQLTLKYVDGHPIVGFSQNEVSFDVADFWPMSDDAQTRLKCLERTADMFNVAGSALENWREKLAARPIEDDEFDILHDFFRTTPQVVATQVFKAIQAGESDVSILIPRDSNYYSRLIGESETNLDMPQYIEDVIGPHFSRQLSWRSIDGLKLALLLSSHSFIPSKLDALAVVPQDFNELLKGLLRQGDRYSQLGAIEFGLANLDKFSDAEPLILQLVNEIKSEDTSNEKGQFHLTAALTILVDGELSRRKTLRGAPPFRRRLAAIAQASLIERELLRVSLDVVPFVDFAIRRGGHSFFIQSLVDLRQEPRWMPDFAEASQLKAEFLGRIFFAAQMNDSKIRSEELRSILFGDAQDGIQALMQFPFPFLPGPLEGAIESKNQLPPDLKKRIESELAASELTANSFAGLVNSALIFKIDADIVAMTSSALQRVKYLVRENGVKVQSFSLLSGLAMLASATRSADFASQVRIFVRVTRRRPSNNIGPRDAFRICMIAAAAHSDLDEWCVFVGDWLDELAFGHLSRSEADALLVDIDRLCKIETRLRRYCAKAIAACEAVRAI